MKRIVTIQDISCVGQCSITVALPIISATGVETAILPTAVLSTHTMFKGFTVKDLQDQIEPISEHWKKEGIGFDAVYTGYLASAEQIDLVIKFFDDFRTDSNLIFADPAMADNGKLYPAFDAEFPKAMARLCGSADIIVPNLTEACLMTGTEYVPEGGAEYYKEILNKLKALGTKKAVVITGVCEEPGKTGFMGMNVADGSIFSFGHDRLPASYHGTGDVFASACVGALMNGKSLPEALKTAALFTSSAIEETMTNDPEKTYGVNFELKIPELLKALGKI